jgi:hypothetical protein
LAARAWVTIVERSQALAARFEEGADREVLSEAADELRTACRPYV